MTGFPYRGFQLCVRGLIGKVVCNVCILMREERPRGVLWTVVFPAPLSDCVGVAVMGISRSAHSDWSRKYGRPLAEQKKRIQALP